MRLDHSTTQKHGATSQKTKSSETAQSSQSLTLPKINSDLTKLSPILIFKRIKPGTPPYWQSLFIHVATWDMLFGNVASIWCITPDFIKICPSVLKLKHTGGEKQTIPRMCLLFTASSAKRAQEPIIAPWRWKQTRQLEGYTATSKWRRRKTRKCYRDTVVLWHVTPCRMEELYRRCRESCWWIKEDPVSTLLPDYTGSHSRKEQSSTSPPWEKGNLSRLDVAVLNFEIGQQRQPPVQ